MGSGSVKTCKMHPLTHITQHKRLGVARSINFMMIMQQEGVCVYKYKRMNKYWFCTTQEIIIESEK